MDFQLPFPPSINHLWRRVGSRTLMSAGGRRFRQAVQAALATQQVQPLAGRLAVRIEVFPPDRRRRDLDNVVKALLDALQHGGAYQDDSQIDELHIRRGNSLPGGQVRVHLEACSSLPVPVPPKPVEPPAISTARQRACLKCDRPFPSAGPGNRICSPCQQANARLDVTEDELQAERGVKRRNGQAIPPDERGSD